MSQFKDLTNRRFGRLFVQRFVGMNKNSKSQWECLCDCGGITTVLGNSLLSGRTQSCWCLHNETVTKKATKHGGRFTPEYRSYTAAKYRCENPHSIKYPDYGGRGIEFRFKSFEEFFAELGLKPTPQHSVDRENVNGHYEKGNVRWATPTEQVNNRRITKPSAISTSTMC